jgi:hypothetical protein
MAQGEFQQQVFAQRQTLTGGFVMKIARWIPWLFWITALYDGILGLIFIIAPDYPFKLFNVTPPNHMGYVQFPAALLLIFALIFLNIARDPVANRGLIIYGILLKAAYCSVSGWYWIATGLPGMWKPFTAADLVMGVLFILAYRKLPAAIYTH